MAAPPPLPTSFPCWCRAVYSWGGEGKRDLGFMEGDLIECLNAGDGSWWTGRLYRDRRTVGSFPSNFVEVLPESFRPMTRSVSPLPVNNAPAPGGTGATKSKSFRKPFEAYSKAPHYTTAKQPVTYVGGGKEPPAPRVEPPAPKTVSLARKNRGPPASTSPAPSVNRMNTTYGNGTGRINGSQNMNLQYGNNRAVSPVPPPQQAPYVPRSVSPALNHQGYTPNAVAPPSRGYSGHEMAPSPHSYNSREVSPAVQGHHGRGQSQYMPQGAPQGSNQFRQDSHSPGSGIQNQQSYYPPGASPTPPIPQQQMVNYNHRRSVSPAPSQQNYMSRSHSPAPFSQNQDHGHRSVSPAPPPQSYNNNARMTRRSVSPAPQQSYYGGNMQRSASPAPPHHQYRNNSMQGSVSPGPPQDYYHGRDAQREASPAPLQHYYGNGMQRSASPAPSHQHYHNNMRRSVSPAPPPQQYYDNAGMQRSRSPAPFSNNYSMGHSDSHYRPESRGVSPGPNGYNSYSRAASPAPLNNYQQSHDQYHRAASPAPLRQNSYDQRALSPAPPPPSHQNTYNRRSPSPGQPPSHEVSYPNDQQFRPYSPQPPTYDQPQPSSDMASTPPPPPPHRHVARQGSATSYMGGSDISRQVSNTSRVGADLSRQGSQVSYDPSVNQISRNGSQTSYMEQQSSRSNGPPLTNGRFRGYSVASASATQSNNRFRPQTPRSTSPMPPPNLTPSPLREAMDGVMEQLETLRLSRVMDGADPEAHWSPDSLEMVSRQSRKESNARPQTAMGLSAQDSGYETWSAGSSQAASQNDKQPVEKNPLPELSSYVERMEKSLEQMHQQNAHPDNPPASIKKTHTFDSVNLPTSPSKESTTSTPSTPSRRIRARKSAYDILNRTFTTKTNVTNTSSTTQSTATTSTSDRSLMSGASAGALSATSAGSFERHRGRAQSALGVHETDADRPDSPFTGVTYHSSHASNASPTRSQSQLAWQDEAPGLGGLVQPRTPKRSIFKKLLDSAKTGVASGRSSIAFTGGDKGTPTRNSPLRNAPASRGLHTSAGNTNAISGNASIGFGNRNSPFGRDAARDMGANKTVDWVQVRRDVNRSNSLSRIERNERMDRARMLDYPAINAVDELYSSMHGDEDANGNPVQNPMHVPTMNLNLVDKNSRFLANIPPSADSAQVATGYVCRPYRSDLQKLRAIFTWVSEKICWEETFEGVVDTRRTLESKRGCSEEYATLVTEMCQAAGIVCELVRGYLKTPGEGLDAGNLPRSNHWWNAVIVDGEWRMMDTCLASPSNPHRAKYSSIGSSSADFFWFLTAPSEICWTHIPEHHGHQHFCQPVAHDILFNLPTVCPPFFRSGIEMVDYNSSVGRIQDMEMVQLKVNVPADVELAAEVEVSGYSRDNDGDTFENGEVVHKRALTQAEWYGGVKRYTIKALLPGDEGFGVLKVYAGKRGLMHTIRDIPHPLAFAIPIVHSGENPPYDFVTRHPTPHAQRHDIYVVQPQCQRLALNNTFVFAIRQHPSASYTSGPQSALTPASNPDGSAQLYNRPGSAMSISAASSNPSSASGSVAGKKPAKLAIQTPGGKILRLMRKEERKGISSSSRVGDEDASDGGTWETIIKCSETGTWRGLVLADRTARWCVFAEWTCL
ncbi:hypothetical protein BROUX41_005587 [Berkeleyomyces rouxiae]|uniref:uncharacterized protein n=1 Tax=Berkeleyomyces rouxiae TaxID=2035830 RepID=UPI003B7D9B0E